VIRSHCIRFRCDFVAISLRRDEEAAENFEVGGWVP
jgi:hypothetical protein